MWYQSAFSNCLLQRSWVHGDESDTTPGTFYCFSCDAFSGIEHFSHAAMAKASPSLYRQSLKLSQQRLKSGGWYRPDVISELQVPWAVEMRLTEKRPKRRRT